MTFVEPGKVLAERLTLDRPLVVFDCETTGKFPERDRIVEITIAKILPDGTTTSFTSLVNPTVPIPAEVTAIHGITDDMVKDAPLFADLARKLAVGIGDAHLAGYNARRFDVPLLVAEFARVNVPFSLEGRHILDPQVIFFKREPRDLTAALKFFCGVETLDDAHRTQADVGATLAVMAAQFEYYTDLPRTVAELSAYSDQRDPSWIDAQGKLVWVQNEACIGFGKKAGKSLRWLAEHEPSYLGWILRSEFPDDVKAIIRACGRGQFPQKAQAAA